MTQRIIKFRAWNPASKNMVYVPNETNSYIQFGNCGFLQEMDWYVSDKGSSCVYAKNSGSDGILMQFTGLHDKNGKEIYEGDILQQKKVGIDCNCARCQELWEEDEEPAVVEWNVEKSGGFVASFGKSDYTNAYLFKHSEIIGNIYENPNLLTP